MKIAQFCPYDVDRPGGVQQHVLDLSGSLANLGHDVTIIAPGVPRKAARPAPVSYPVPVIRVGTGQLVYFNETMFEISVAIGRERGKLDRLMRLAGFDIVHFHTPLNPFLCFQGLYRSAAANVATFHAVPPETSSSAPIQRWLNRLFSQLISKRLDRVILASLVQKEMGLKGSVLPPCTSLSQFCDDTPPLARFDSDHVNVLFLGRLERRKGSMLLLRAHAELCRKGLPMRLLVAGEGPERHMLDHYVATEHVPDVVFLGRMDHFKVPSLLAACDIFCAPSPHAEGFGIVLAEAMASGKAIVAADNAGYRTVLQGEAAEFLAKPGDVADLCAKLELLVTRPDLRQRLGAWGRQEAMRYDSDRLAPAFLSIYEEALRMKAQRTSLSK